MNQEKLKEQFEEFSIYINGVKKCIRKLERKGSNDDLQKVLIDVSRLISASKTVVEEWEYLSEDVKPLLHQLDK